MNSWWAPFGPPTAPESSGTTSSTAGCRRPIKLVHVTMDFQEGTEEEFSRSIPSYEAKAAGLMDQKPDLIRVLGAPPFMILRFDGESRVIRGWEEKYGVPMFTSGQNHVRALRALGVTRLLGGTYLPDNLNNIFAQYLREAGFDVIAMEGMDAPFHEVPNMPGHRHRRAPEAVVPPPPRRRGPLPAGFRLEDPGCPRRH